MKKLLVKFYFFLMDLLAWVQWGWLRKLVLRKEFNLTLEDRAKAFKILKDRNVIILTYSKSHLSSYASKFAHFLLTGEKATYSHAALNIEPDGTNFQIIEAISKGVVISKFDEVFNCDGFCLLAPKRYTKRHFDSLVWDYQKELGKGYDNYFKLKDDKERSCIEVVFAKLQAFSTWQENMPVLDYMIKKEKNLTPELLRDCPDFSVLLEIKR